MSFEHAFVERSQRLALHVSTTIHDEFVGEDGAQLRLVVLSEVADKHAGVDAGHLTDFLKRLVAPAAMALRMSSMGTGLSGFFFGKLPAMSLKVADLALRSTLSSSVTSYESLACGFTPNKRAMALGSVV